MRYLIITIFIIVPFFVTSCKNTKKEDKINIKNIIKQNNADSSINFIELNELEKLMAKKPKKVMILFYQPNCPYCNEMKENTLLDNNIIKIVNDNFYAVMINGKSKDEIMFRGITYVNDHPNPEDNPWRHNLFVELVNPYNGAYYWPTTVFLNEEFEKIRDFPGLQKIPQFKRALHNMIKR